MEGEGIYVGFSVSVDSISLRLIGGELYEYGWDCYPMAYTENGTNPYSFFFRTATRGPWENWGELNNAQYLFGALMSGSGKEFALNVDGFGTVYSVKDEQPQVPVKLSSLGSAGASGIDYVVTLADGSTTEPLHYDLPNSLAFGQHATINLPLPAETQPGRHPKSLAVTKVNGNDNESDHNVASGTVITLSERSNRKPTVEEFTATWCNKGPRGIVARERMKVNFPDQLVIIANHVNGKGVTDPMALDDYFAQAIGDDPTSFVIQTAINRINVMDSYFGTTYGRNNAIRLDLQEAVKGLALAKLKLVPVWDEEEAVVTMNTDVTFLYSDDQATYALAYVLTEDGMVGDTEEWNQQNTYSGQDWLDTSDWLYPWIQKRTSVSGVVYDDVAIAAWGIGKGLEESLPATIEEGQTYHHSMSYDTGLNELLQDNSKLKVAVLLFNTETGEIVNAEQCRILTAEEANGIAAVALSTQQTGQVYDLSGRRVGPWNTLPKGIYVIDVNGKQYKVKK